MPGPNNVQALQMVQDNLVRLLLLTTQLCASPTQAALDAVVAAYQTAAPLGQAAGVVVAKPSYSLDGESYQWESYRVSLENSIQTVQKLIVLLGGSYIVRSQGKV